MRISKDYMLRKVAGEYLLIPMGQTALRVQGLVGMSESAHLLYQRLQSDCTKENLVQCLLGEYDVSEAEARADVDAFLAQMLELGVLEDAQ